MGKFLDHIRDIDLFGAPVQLSYRGNRKFRTVCGGCVTLTLILVILALLPSKIIMELNEPTYSNSPQLVETSKNFTFDYTHSMFAGSISAYKDDGTELSRSTVDSQLRIVFGFGTFGYGIT